MSCQYVTLEAGIRFDTGEASASRGLWSGFLKVPLASVWDQRRLKSMCGAFLHSCCYATKQLSVFLDVMALTFTTRGVQGLRQTTNSETPRGMLRSRAPLFAVFSSTRYSLQARKMKHGCNMYFFCFFLKGIGEFFQRGPVDSSRGIPEHLWTDARVSSGSFVRSEITCGLWRVYIFNRKPAWELWSFWKRDNRRQRAGIAHPTLIFLFFFHFSPSSSESAPELGWSWETQKTQNTCYWEDESRNEDGESLKHINTKRGWASSHHAGVFTQKNTWREAMIYSASKE